MKPSKIVIEVTSEGEIILLKDTEGRTVEYSVDVLTAEEAKEAKAEEAKEISPIENEGKNTSTSSSHKLNRTNNSTYEEIVS
jgi:hypothetical protein